MNQDQLTPIFPEVIDSTIRGEYVSCGMKAFYSRIFGLSAKGGSVHLVAGGAFAKGVEVTRNKFYLEGMNESDAIVEGVIASFVKYGSFEPEDKYQTKSAERVAYAIAEYFAEYPLATDRIQPYYQADGRPAIEFEFSFPLEIAHPDTGDPLIYGGRFDMIGEYMGDLWSVDEKTATRLGPQWLRSFSLRGQFLGYCYAARMFGLPVNGFIVRGISFLKDYYGHAEVPEVVPDNRIQLWRAQLNKDVQRMVNDYVQFRDHGIMFDYAFNDACNSYGKCQFRDTLCNKENWEEWWMQYFEISRWNPLTGKDEVDHEKPVLTSLES